MSTARHFIQQIHPTPSWSDPKSLSISVRPSGRLVLTNNGKKALRLAGNEAYHRKIVEFFAIDSAHGMISLIGNAPLVHLPPELRWWRSVGRVLFSRICSASGAEAGRSGIMSDDVTNKLRVLFDGMPLIVGADYVTVSSLVDLCDEMVSVLEAERLRSKDTSILSYLRSTFPDWCQVGRLVFHLAEQGEESEHPFAFVITYELLDESGHTSSCTLGVANKTFRDSGDQNALLAMLDPLKSAQEFCPFLKIVCESGEIFFPLGLNASEAFQLLRVTDKLSEYGITLRYPKWRGGGPRRPKISVTIGDKNPKGVQVGYDSLLDFSLNIALGDTKLTQREIEALLKAGEGLVRLKGQWVEVHAATLTSEVGLWRSIEKQVKKDGLSFVDAIKLLSGAHGLSSFISPGEAVNLTEIVNPEAGNWLQGVLESLHGEQGNGLKVKSVKSLNARLRPYQLCGVEWLWRLYSLKMSGCLADDMGLGKTIQMISLLLLIKEQEAQVSSSLLVVPASLLGNWQKEIDCFAPSLKILVAHPSELDRNALTKLSQAKIERYDLIITSYAYLQRLDALSEFKWNCIILDEAQAIKNAGTMQTKRAKTLKSKVRFALTGTPVENRLGDLWSLFDFLSPGLLGSGKEFTNFVKKLSSAQTINYAPLRNLVKPYILRRMKTDKSIINDLPEKTELKAFCQLSKAQASLYANLVKEMQNAINSAEGVKRKGLILSYLQQFKQVCNHPSQWSGDSAYHKSSSGKFDRLQEICEEINDRQEKALIFTQFREMTGPLNHVLEKVFGRAGLVLHGGTAIGKRKKYVEEFSSEEGPPFFVLSLKAGGTGLNLTQASHVIHFDRWWNPAVEDQATDRAFRIGQKRNVMVHKFVTRGTLEERIDQMIEDKRFLSKALLSDGAEKGLTELSNDELLALVALDLRHAVV
jgi:superfamily II DNA or RNA helicase